MKVQEKQSARKLRKENGWSIKKIAKELGVAKSSVSLWVRDIELTKEQEISLYCANKNGSDGSSKIKKNYAEKRIEYQEKGFENAKSQSILNAIGCALYWAEGAKDKNSIRFSNSDPDMLVLFIEFLEKCLHIEKKDITVYIQCYDDIKSVEEIEIFWLSKLDLPRESLKKTTINKISKSSLKKRTNKLMYGTCRIVINSTEKVQNIFGSLKYYGNFKHKCCE